MPRSTICSTASTRCSAPGLSSRPPPDPEANLASETVIGSCADGGMVPAMGVLAASTRPSLDDAGLDDFQRVLVTIASRYDGEATWATFAIHAGAIALPRRIAATLDELAGRGFLH